MNKLNSDGINLVDLMARICVVMQRMDPSAFRNFLITGIIMNVVGNMPDKYWDEFQVKDRCTCGKDGCPDCKVTQQCMPALGQLRQFHLNLIKKGSDETFTQVRPEDIMQMVGAIRKISKEEKKQNDNGDQSFCM